MATGERCLIIAMKVLQNLEKQGKSFNVVNARFVKPLDEEFLSNLTEEYVITMEDNVANGGFGALVNNYIIKAGKACQIRNFAYRDEFIPQGSIAALQKEYGVDCEEIESYLAGILE